MFSLIADEATDCAAMAQMALCVRYLKDSEIREEFLGVQMDYIRGQGYDGASKMSGLYRGVQARIRQQYPEAVYTHCKAHCLNLAIIHASKCTYVRNMMATVQTVAFAFNMSAKRLLKFQETLGCDPTSREEMEERQKLQSSCETRWAARADAFHTFLCLYRTVVTSLEDLGANGDTKAAANSLSVLQFDFIITLVTAEHVLAAVVELSTMLQQKACHLLRAATETRVIIATLKASKMKCLALLMVVPVSTATAERSFSTMRRVKSYLRSTMTTERLSGLGLLNIYQEKKLDAERIVDMFAAKKERRLALIFKV
ncbi:52 kDa repressor of the inhibitor of the protein kinase-like [Ruditapes philippinarum]|uniref:52 kDa repressor of the inhibitor of the protein kinase-like n=1 Tax=Ruditapes philippinarum TaxID=129788 RepID=UPI00295BB9F4|nr:52 kDa repressor of the inhibitor of the protein kinase-like [Ruditapes philippinarum]